MKKVLLVMIVSALLIFSVSAAEKDEIVEKWKQLKPAFFELNPYVEEPETEEEWRGGKLKQGFIDDGLNFLNFCRFVAGLEELSYTHENSDAMQNAALLYSHQVFFGDEYKPENMAEELYNPAQSILNSSLKSFGFDNLDQTVHGFINSRGGNMHTLKPRTTLLSPSASTISFGFYETYATAYVTSTEEKTDYDYIAWPSAEYFPTMFVKDDLPWSITLNPEKYQTPDLKNITIRIENTKTNTIIELKADREYSYYTDGSVYMGVDGDTNTIIFKPDSKDIKNWFNSPEFNVRITVFGIYTTEGVETSAEYLVRFFDMRETLLAGFPDSESIYLNHKAAVADLVASNVLRGYTDGTLRPQDKITRAEFTAMLLRYMGIEPSESDEAIFSDVTSEHWAMGYINKAYEIGAINGTAPGIFSPEEIVTAQQAMKIITIVKDFTKNVDIEASGGYPLAYYNLGYELGLLDYVDEDEDFEYPLGRSDVARILYNTSNITKFWVEIYNGKTVIWHRDREGKSYGYYSFVKFAPQQ